MTTNHETCDSLAGLLVDYADGDLSEEAAGRVTAHLASCPRCRDELRRLRRSLDLALEIWREPAARPRREIPQSTAVRPRRLPVPLAALAACAAAVAVAASVWFLTRGGPAADPQVVDAPADAGAAHGHPRDRRLARQDAESRDSASGGPAEEPDELEDLTALIEREAQAARLAASAEILASHPELEEYALLARRYLHETYADTTAGRLDPGSPTGLAPVDQ